MILVGICDDEKKHRQIIKELCERYFAENAIECDYIEFSSGEEIIDYRGERMILLFLDIEMGETSGLDVLHNIRNSQKIWRIAFVSSHEEQRLDTIDLKTLAFLEKPVKYEAIKKCLGIAIKENAENVSVTFTMLEGKRSIELSDIVYIKADKHYANICTKQYSFISFDSIKHYEEQLKGTSMIRIHKSYLVNMQYIKKMSATEVIMMEGLRLQIGRNFNASVKEKYFDYIRSVTIGRSSGI